ncbi:sigma-70 family RNA polymerase sigma factor [Sporosarcina saromensis]|uniref:Sigma-70 family RNA polymerase sigma factor n=1 Tax=Sporosarcina saromensis TaxID=359365 RepID=A0ABU4G822_9BACL|nr:sigma-70 family RNA polymerase sigma factor [Sporosarcina saromensis]MDW0113128.1 sigma-70 family RNA polymerase sigma factor [Sporosarcina saromensis]
MLNFEDVLAQYEPMITANIRQLNIYREHEQYRQTGRVALWHAWRKFDKEKGNFTPYAYRSIRGAMMDEMMKENRSEERFMPAENEKLTFWIEEGVCEEEGWVDRLSQAVEQLTEEEKQLLNWLFIERDTQADCAKRLGISVAGVKKRRQRLLEKLRGVMEGGSE